MCPLNLRTFTFSIMVSLLKHTCFPTRGNHYSDLLLFTSLILFIIMLHIIIYYFIIFLAFYKCNCIRCI